MSRPQKNSAPQNTSSGQEEKKTRSKLAEWVSFAIASLIVGSIAGLTIYLWATDRDYPPVIVIRQTGAIREEDGQFYIPYEVSNIGGETAEKVQVIAEIEQQGVTAQRNIQIDFLAENETEAGAFIFTEDPGAGDLILQVGSYEIP